jgi:hypothetical protein
MWVPALPSCHRLVKLPSFPSSPPQPASQPTLGFGFQSFGLALQGSFSDACLVVYLCLP